MRVTPADVLARMAHEELRIVKAIKTAMAALPMGDHRRWESLNAIWRIRADAIEDPELGRGRPLPPRLWDATVDMVMRAFCEEWDEIARRRRRYRPDVMFFVFPPMDQESRVAEMHGAVADRFGVDLKVVRLAFARHTREHSFSNADGNPPPPARWVPLMPRRVIVG